MFGFICTEVSALTAEIRFHRVPTCREEQREARLFLHLHHGGERRPSGPQGIAAHVMSPKRTIKQEPHPHLSHVEKLSAGLLQDNRDQAVSCSNNVIKAIINQQILILAA